jgi:hypothetical protein
VSTEVSVGSRTSKTITNSSTICDLNMNVQLNSYNPQSNWYFSDISGVCKNIDVYMKYAITFIFFIWMYSVVRQSSERYLRNVYENRCLEKIFEEWSKKYTAIETNEEFRNLMGLISNCCRLIASRKVLYKI